MGHHPYRAAPPVAPRSCEGRLSRLRRWVRARVVDFMWRVAAEELTDSQWVRRALGGRWALVHVLPPLALVRGPTGRVYAPHVLPQKEWTVWLSVPCCPAEWPPSLGDSPVDVRRNATRDDHLRRCTCEVWS